MSSGPVMFGPDGTQLAFGSHAIDLGPKDTDDSSDTGPPDDLGTGQDIYVRNLVTGTTRMVTANAAGTDSPNHSSRSAVFSPDGFASPSKTMPPTSARPIATSSGTWTSPRSTVPTHVIDLETNDGTCVVPDPEQPNLIACDFGTMPPDSSASATITVTVNAPTSETLSAIALAHAETPDPDGADNWAQTDVTVIDAAP